MKYEKFVIKNFKGIEEIKLDLSKRAFGNIFPLVGLNESGKTTILEAINFYVTHPEDGTEYELIHKKDLGDFTGKIEVVCTLTLEDTDKENIKSFLENNDLRVSTNAEKVIVTKTYSYSNASFQDHKYVTKFQPNITVLEGAQRRTPRNFLTNYQELHEELMEYLEDFEPEILYFPDFLFDFPEKIYLENIDTLPEGKERDTQKKYNKILDDILHTINPSYSLFDFLTKIKDLDTPSSQAAASQIKQQVSSILNMKILEPWEQIFAGASKTIIIEISNDATGWFLQIKINEGTTTFLVNERSLGFRWFFGFILFTEFRKAREDENGEYLFMFDEPASNLHESSQQKLLDLFENLTDRSKILYTTHSPYLLSPKFILNAYVVKDEGREGENDFEFRQNIKAVPYRQFVANHPTQETHFKPLLDILDFVPNEFEQTDKIVFFEGKFDYYTFKWLLNTLHNGNYDFKFYPGASVNKYEKIFREYLAHNKIFIAVFDADEPGKDAINKYIREISCELKEHVFTLKDVDISFDTYTTEFLFTSDDRLKIQQQSFPNETEYEKSMFNTAIQELFVKEEVIELSEETKDNIKKVFDFIKNKFEALES